MMNFTNTRYSGFWTLLVTALTSVVLAAGCASLNQNECQYADWRSIGYEDGARGYPAARVGSHRKACAEYGVTPDFEQYEMGRLDGLREFCRPVKGYRLGANGRTYPDVCPSDLERPFRRAFRHGKRLYGLKQEVKATQQNLNTLYDEQIRLADAIDAKEAELVMNNISRSRRIFLLGELKDLSQQQRLVSDDIVRLEYAMQDLRHDLSRLQAKNPYR